MTISTDEFCSRLIGHLSMLEIAVSDCGLDVLISRLSKYMGLHFQSSCHMEKTSDDLATSHLSTVHKLY